jgi:hypothetical protein
LTAQTNMPKCTTDSGATHPWPHASDDGSALPRFEKPLPTLLSVIAGIVDLTVFLTPGNIFTAHITGNVALVAALVVRGGRMNLAEVLTIPFRHRRCHPVATRQSIGQTRSGPGAVAPPGSVSSARWRVDFQRQHQTVGGPSPLACGSERGKGFGRDVCIRRESAERQPQQQGTHGGLRFNAPLPLYFHNTMSLGYVRNMLSPQYFPSGMPAKTEQ